MSECGLGCWQLGGGWGNPWDDATAQEILEAAYANGIRFFDTADVYGDGQSEQSVGRFRQSHSDITVATKLGRRGIYPDGYSEESVYYATRESMERLGLSRIDLTQLHCVPTGVLRKGKIFDWLRQLREDGLIGAFGASVESVEEGLICLEQEGLTSLQVIFNIFRQKPARELFAKAAERGVGIIARLPLASGLLTGKMTSDTVFREEDHRNFNREGAAFNVGETFAGLPFEKGVALSERLNDYVPEGLTMAEMALRWILDHEEVSVIIPGASSIEQAEANARISDLPPLPSTLHEQLKEFYDQEVHDHIRGVY